MSALFYIVPTSCVVAVRRCDEMLEYTYRNVLLNNNDHISLVLQIMINFGLF